MNVQLKYGKQTIDLDTPEGSDILEVTEPVFDIDKKKFQEQLSITLPDNPEIYNNVGIVVSDKTRLCGYPEYLPWITEILHKKGADKKQITFYIAYGTHPKQSEEESLASYGEIFKSYRFIHHDCYDEESLTEIGITKRGTPVRIRKDILESSLLLTFGAISHHYFAGYGGGRKLLFPGLAARKSVYKNHSLFLDLENRRLSDGCQPGNLEGNPIAEDLKEIDSCLPPKVSVHGLLNSEGRVIRLLIGKDYGDFEQACREHDTCYRSKIGRQFNLVIASSGGYPKDINFIQGHKSIHHASAFVKDGGRLIILCECIDGIGSDYFMKFLEAGSFERAFSVLEENYEGNGGTALSMMTKTNRINIYMHTDLSNKECRTLNVSKVNIEEIQDLINKEKGVIAVIRNASLLIR